MTADSRIASAPANTSYVIRPGRPMVRTTFQFAAHITARDDLSGVDTLNAAAEVALDWAASKFPGPLPPSSRQGQSFSIEEHGQSVHVASISELGLWSLRLTQPDSPYKDRPAVPGRGWTTEIALAAVERRVKVAARVLCASLPYANAPVTYSRPRIIVDLAERFELSDSRRVTPEPWRIQTESDLDALLAHLTNPLRDTPVYLLTQPDSARLGLSVREYLLDEVDLAQRMLGIATVVTLPRDLNGLWTQIVGKEWSASHGAVRTYRPGLDFDAQPPSAHPLALATTVLAFERDGRQAQDAFLRFLVHQAHEHAAIKPIALAPCLFYADARQRELELGRSRARDDQDWRTLLEEDARASRQRAEESEGLAESYAAEVDELRTQLQSEQIENDQLRGALAAQRRRIEALQSKAPEQAISFPTTFDGMGDWVKAHLDDRLMLHPRCNRSLSRAEYEQPELIYRALYALANDYRSMRLGVAGAREKWEESLKALNMDYAPSITDTRAGEEGDEYFIEYPLGSRRKQKLGWHLRRGNTRDIRRSARIYFLWDEQRERVVVGWLPSHLAIRST